MKLTLTDDDGIVIETWYLPDELANAEHIKNTIELRLETFESRKEFEELTKTNCPHCGLTLDKCECVSLI